MSTISKEAIDEARRLLENSHRVGASGIAAALQKHMDATARGEARAEARAEEKETLAWDRDQLLERVQELEAARQRLGEMHAAAEARATSIWYEKEALLSGLRWALAQEDAGELRARVAALVDEYAP